jgi:hypothetical protein
VHPIAEVNNQTNIWERPRRGILIRLETGTKVIIVKEASGRRRNWHEVLWKSPEGEVFQGVVRKKDLDITSTPEAFGRRFFD